MSSYMEPPEAFSEELIGRTLDYMSSIQNSEVVFD